MSGIDWSQLYERRKTIVKNKESNIFLTLDDPIFIDLDAAGEHSPEKKLNERDYARLLKTGSPARNFIKLFNGH